MAGKVPLQKQVPCVNSSKCNKLWSEKYSAFEISDSLKGQSHWKTVSWRWKFCRLFKRGEITWLFLSKIIGWSKGCDREREAPPLVALCQNRYPSSLLPPRKFSFWVFSGSYYELSDESNIFTVKKRYGTGNQTQNFFHLELLKPFPTCRRADLVYISSYFVDSDRSAIQSCCIRVSEMICGLLACPIYSMDPSRSQCRSFVLSANRS